VPDHTDAEHLDSSIALCDLQYFVRGVTECLPPAIGILLTQINGRCR
jgi:hypothetical protein